MKRMTSLVFIGVLLLSAAAFAQNLVPNGNFEKWQSNGEPAGWHSRITGVITISEYKDPEHKKGLLYKHFRDGCGYDWGRIRPWPGLVCPQCHQMIATEESADWYVKNYQNVSAGDGKSGKGVTLKMDEAVGANQGVRVCSDFMKAEKGAGYEFGVDVKANLSVQIFVECFAPVDDDTEAKDWVKTLSAEVNPFKHMTRLKRTARGHIYQDAGANWTHFVDQFVMTENPRYQFDRMYMSLYAYGHVGEASFDNAYIRKMSPAEVAAYRLKYPAKDPRFK